MATTGKAAWEKHFYGKGDIATTIKKETTAYDVTNISSVLGIVPAHTPITVKATKIYETKVPIEFKHGTKVWKCRVKFDDIQKPGSKSTVNPGNDRTIPNKALTPDGLGLGGKTIEKSQYLATVNAAIDACKTVQLPIKQVLKDLLAKSDKKDLAMLNESIKYISDKDVAVIGKDFGELSGAWWFINNYDPKLSFVEFPARSNEPLVDYYVGYPNKVKLRVSAKAEAGAAPALNPIWDSIKDKSFSGNDAAVKTFISEIVNNNGLESIIKASQHFGSTGYAAVGTLIGKPSNYTSDDIEKWLSSYKDATALNNILTTKLYSKINKSAKLDTIQKILNEAGARRCGIILSPMAYNLVDEVNANKSYKNFLTQICKSLNVEQLYINLRKNATTMNYKLKGFKASEFSFEYHSNAGNPGGNKIGFKMDL